MTRPFLQMSQVKGCPSAAIAYPLAVALPAQSAGRFLNGCVSYFTLGEISASPPRTLLTATVMDIPHSAERIFGAAGPG
jgi:hypothetical protein